MHVARTRTRLVGIFVALALSLGVAAAPASAQQQTGLVNVAVTDNTVQVPIAVAANVCGVQAAVLAAQIVQGPVNCDAEANAMAVAPTAGDGSGGTATQSGLVNIIIADNTVQVPVAVAANICGVQLAILAANVNQADVACAADALAIAQATPA
jgi:predicted metal-dependent HD superfamily phosphohydrolase